jgi:hypothetical protein
MDINSHHQMNDLFAQLGLPSDNRSIKDFIENHHISGNIRLEQAPFWNQSQAAFLAESISEDADWAELVDHLDAELRQ